MTLRSVLMTLTALAVSAGLPARVCAQARVVTAAHLATAGTGPTPAPAYSTPNNVTLRGGQLLVVCLSVRGDDGGTRSVQWNGLPLTQAVACAGPGGANTGSVS